MAERKEGLQMNGCFAKLEYNSETDTFTLLSKYPGQDWEIVSECKCVRRENARADEECNYIHFHILRSLEYLIDRGFTLA